MKIVSQHQSTNQLMLCPQVHILLILFDKKFLLTGSSISADIGHGGSPSG